MLVKIVRFLLGFLTVTSIGRVLSELSACAYDAPLSSMTTHVSHFLFNCCFGFSVLRP